MTASPRFARLAGELDRQWVWVFSPIWLTLSVIGAVASATRRCLRHASFPRKAARMAAVAGEASPASGADNTPLDVRQSLSPFEALVLRPLAGQPRLDALFSEHPTAGRKRNRDKQRRILATICETPPTTDIGAAMLLDLVFDQTYGVSRRGRLEPYQQRQLLWSPGEEGAVRDIFAECRNTG